MVVEFQEREIKCQSRCVALQKPVRTAGRLARCDVSNARAQGQGSWEQLCSLCQHPPRRCCHLRGSKDAPHGRLCHSPRRHAQVLLLIQRARSSAGHMRWGHRGAGPTQGLMRMLPGCPALASSCPQAVREQYSDYVAFLHLQKVPCRVLVPLLPAFLGNINV